MTGEFKYRNRSEIRSGQYTGMHITEALDDFRNAIMNIKNQGNLNPMGPVPPPGSIASLTATANNTGFVSFVIQDNSQVNRGIIYHIEASATPQFSAPLLIYSGPSMNPPPYFAGKQTLFFRAFSQYPTSAPSSVVYFGTPTSPTAVVGGGAVAAPPVVPSVGSGSDPSNNPRPGSGFGSSNNRGQNQAPRTNRSKS
jgi:hypothetical protein